MASDSNGSDEIGRFEAQYRENPDSLVFARLADACRKAGDPERGLSILADGIARHPDYPSAHIVRARCLVDLDRLADAEASLRRVVELDPQNLVAIQGLANLAERRDDPAEAVHWYERIATLDPMNVEAAAALQRLRPASPPAGLEPLPAPSEEWWSSPAFQVESDEANLPDEADVPEQADGPDDTDPAMEEVPDPPAEDPVRIVAEELTDAAVEPDGAAEDEPGTAWWFEDPGEDEPADDGDLLTRTMAELYTRQGLLDEAAAIYRELLTDRPDDEGLRRALDDLERRLDGADDESEREGPPEESEAPPEAADASPASETVAGAGAATSVEASATDQVPDAADSAREPGADVPSVDRFATHPVPARSGTGEVLDDWLRRLAK